MSVKPSVDGLGAAMLLSVTLLFAFNNVVIKVTNGGFEPVFAAALRSVGAVICVGAYMRWRQFGFHWQREIWPWGLLTGLLFALEFILMFTALDLTTVARASVFLYTMPVWLALAAHVFLPGERMTRLKAIGLGLAFVGVVVALTGGRVEGVGSLAGDLCALFAAFAWAGIALVARASPLRGVRAEMQLFYQVLVSAPILLLVAPQFGPLIRDLAPIHLWGLAFQIVFSVSLGFVVWLWLLSRYPAAQVASFSFLGPIFGVGLGWLLLSEPVGLRVLGALALVAMGLFFITRSAPVASRAAEGG